MASASKRGKFIYEHVYEEDDLVDDFFFDELTKHIVPTKVTSLVEYLDLPEAKFDFLQDYLVQNKSVQWVLDLWRGQLDALFTVKQFVQEIKLWERKGFVEPDIWSHLESSLQPHLMPSNQFNNSFASADTVSTSKEKEISSNEKIQGDQSSPKTELRPWDLGEKGNLLSDFIKRQGNNPPLKKIHLFKYSMPESKWAELLQFTSKCKNLRELNLEYNTIGEAGYWLAQSIRSWDNPPLLELSLSNCSIPEQVWPELLQSLSSCKQLTKLDLLNSDIWGAGYYLAKSLNQPLKHLDLSNCSILEQVWPELLQSLSSCKKLTYLNLWGNTIGEAGSYLAKVITSLGKNLSLELLDLSYCSIPEELWPELFQSISSCKRLRDLYLDGNTVTDCLQSFLADPHPGLKSLNMLHLEQTAVSKSDVQHLTHLVKSNKLPHLQTLCLNESDWTHVEDELEQLKEACCEKSGLRLCLDIWWLDNEKFKQTQIRKQILPKKQQRLNRAYKSTCQEDTIEVFNACLNLVGHKGAGKTSLATRLMSKEFRPHVKSTEGISIHHVKSRFMKNEQKMEKWDETSLDSSSYLKDFSHAVLSKLKSIKLEQRSSTLKQKVARAANKSDLDVEKSADNTSQQGIKSSENNLEMSYSKGNTGEQINANNTQDQSKLDTDENGAEKQSRGLKVKVKSVPNQIPMGNLRITSLNKKLMEEILSYEDALPEQQSDDQSMSICLRDFSGENEFFTTHQFFIGDESTTLIVIDMTKPLHDMLEKSPKVGHPNTPAAVLHYWLNLLHVKACEKGLQPNVVLVLTHRDMKQDNNSEMEVETYINAIMRNLQGHPYSKLINNNNIYVVDNKSGNDTEFEHLQSKLLQYLSQQSSWGSQIPVRWMKLKADMIEKSRNEQRRFLDLAMVSEQANQYGMNEKDIELFLRNQNILGHFIYYPEPELRENVITDPQWVVDKVTILTSHHRFLKTQGLKPQTVHDFMSGQVTRNVLEEIWEEREVELFIQLMVHFNLLIALDELPQRFIMPCMLPQQNVKTQGKAFENMEMIYSAFHTLRSLSSFFIGTFHQLISECSKIKLWKLFKCENHPSYTDASFEMKKGIRLVLAIGKHESLQISIWCPKNVFKEDISKLHKYFKEPRCLLSAKMEKFGFTQADTYETLCPYSKSTDGHACLIPLREYHHPRSNRFSYWTLKHKCEFHEKVLRQTMVPSLLMISSDAGGQNLKEIVRNLSHHDTQKYTYPVSIEKNEKEFSATITSGDSSIIQDKGSNISIEVEKGTRAVIMQHIHTNLEALGYTSSSNECIVSPVVTVHTLEICQPNLMPHQGDQFMFIKKDACDDHMIDSQSMPHIQSRKSEDQPIRPEASSPEGAEFPDDGQDSSNDQPMKYETSSADKVTDQSMKCEATPQNEAAFFVKPEPLFPEQAAISDDNQSMKLESYKKAEDSEKDYLKKLGNVSAEEGTNDGNQAMKHELKEGRQSEEHSSEGSRYFHLQPIKPERKSFDSTEDSDDEGKALSSVVQSDIQGAHSSNMYPEEPKYSVYQNLKAGSVYKFKLTIPHYVEEEDLVPLIQVKWGNIHKKLWDIRKGKPEDKFEPYCEVYQDHVVVYSTHFCDVVCTCPEKICASKLLAFPFGQIDSRSGRKETYTKVKTYLCNHLYQDVSLRKTLQTSAGAFGLEMLEQLVVPVNPAVDITKSKATVRLNVTGSDPWGPTKPDVKWNAAKKQMTETTNLSQILDHVVNGHLCKSEPFDAANFGLIATGAIEMFHGNISVNVSGVKGRPKNADIWIPPKQVDPEKPKLRKKTKGKRKEKPTDNDSPPRKVTEPEVRVIADSAANIQPKKKSGKVQPVLTDATRTQKRKLPPDARVQDTSSKVQKVPDDKELTDVMVLKLAKRINKPIDLYSLGILGLDMKEEVLAGHLQNKKDDIYMAALEVLKTWRTSQPNRTVAYQKLCEALRQKGVDMESLIEEALQ